jgi:hypothetical protein
MSRPIFVVCVDSGWGTQYSESRLSVFIYFCSSQKKPTANMVLDTNALSQLYASEAAPFKAKQLFKFLDKATPSKLCATLKTTGHLTKQLLLFVRGQTFVRMSVPIHSADATNQSAILGVYGNDLDVLAPASINGARLDKWVSVLVPKSAALKCKLPVLTADPVHLDPPETSGDQAGSQRLRFVFDTAEDTPVIALLPVVFAVPIGESIAGGVRLNTEPPQVVTMDMRPCEAARVWMTALNHLMTHHKRAVDSPRRPDLQRRGSRSHPLRRPSSRHLD